MIFALLLQLTSTVPTPTPIVLLDTSGAVAIASKGPYVSDLEPDRAEIRWEVGDAPPPQRFTLSSGGSAVELPVTVDDGMAVVSLPVVPDTLYRYHAFEGRFDLGERSFRSLPRRGEPVRFAVFGDTRTGNDVHARLASRIADDAPDVVLNTGDLVVYGADPLVWQPLFEAERKMLSSVVMLPAVGNHDARGIFNASHWERYFTEGRHYVRDVGGVRIFFVDSTAPFESGSEQYAWLKAGLEEAARARARGDLDWIAVIHHHPAISSGYHGTDPTVARELVPLYEAAGVDVVFTGHDHIYERLEKNGVVYFVTGGGGAPLYQGTGLPETHAYARANHYLRVAADRKALTVEAVDLDGNRLDSITLDRDRPRPAPAPPEPGDTLPEIASSGVLLLAAAIAWTWSARF